MTQGSDPRSEKYPTGRLRRRSVIGGLAALAGASMAGRSLPQRAEAADTPLLIGQNNSATNQTALAGSVGDLASLLVLQNNAGDGRALTAVAGGSGMSGGVAGGAGVAVANVNSTPERGVLVVQYSNDGAGALVLARKARQNIGYFPARADDTLFSISVEGNDNAPNSGTPRIVEGARIDVNADEDWQVTRHGTRMTFQTTRNGEASPTPRMAFDGSGAVVVPAGTQLQVQGPATFEAAATFNAAVSASGPESGFSGDGSGLTNLNASSLSVGTVDDARLSSRIPRRGAAVNAFGGQLRARGFAGPRGSAPAFAAAGRIQVPRGKTRVAVTAAGISPAVDILVTLQSAAGAGVVVEHVEKRRGGFDLVLNKPSTRAATAAYFVFRSS